jgi:phosphatidylglycerol:prolipoprotein diacylglycerol transferase
MAAAAMREWARVSAHLRAPGSRHLRLTARLSLCQFLVANEEPLLIPYVEEPVLMLGPFRISAFALLVVMAVCVGFAIVSRHAERFGLERDLAERAVTWTIFWGFVGSRFVDLAAYQPQLLFERPFELLRIWTDMSSFGGIIGGIGAALVWMHRNRRSTDEALRFIDLLAFAFPFAWILGRAGCALRHDHLGRASDSWLAVAAPSGPRFDLGLLELLITIPIAAGFAVLARRARPKGLYAALFFASYGTARFWLDFLRTEDTRYFGWTPAQYASLAAAGAGAFGLWAIARRARSAH